MIGFTLFILAALQIWDIWLTTRILRAGGRELNGVMAALMAATGSAWGLVKYVVAMGAGIWLAKAGMTWAIWPIIAVMALVVDHNLGEWQKTKSRRGNS